MNVILRIEMMDAFGVDSAFEGRHRAMMAHTPVSKAATMDSSVLTKAAKPLGVPAPSNLSHEEAQIEGADMDQQAPWVGCHRRQIRLGAQQTPRQRRGVPFVGVSQTHGDDGLRFQVDRVLGFAPGACDDPSSS